MFSRNVIVTLFVINKYYLLRNIEKKNIFLYSSAATRQTAYKAIRDKFEESEFTKNNYVYI